MEIDVNVNKNIKIRYIKVSFFFRILKDMRFTSSCLYYAIVFLHKQENRTSCHLHRQGVTWQGGSKDVKNGGPLCEEYVDEV